MAYKQPYKQVANNDGASEPITAAVLGALKLGKVLLTGAKAAKGAGAVAKGVKAGKLATKAAKITTKANKIGKATNKGIRLAKKAEKVATRSKNVFEKGSNAMEKASNFNKKINNINSTITKVEDGTTKIQKGYNEKISNLAKNLGTDSDKVDQFVKKSASNLGENIVSKIKPSEKENVSPNTSEKTTIINTPSVETKEPELSGYGNPQGPSLGEGYSNPSSVSKSDQAVNAITPKKNDFISNFHAPVTIKGVTFDAGDAVRAGRLLYNVIKDKNTEKRALNSLLAPEELPKIKKLKNIESESDKRQSLPKATVANASMPNKSNKISIEKIKGKDYKVVDNLDGLGMPEIPSLVKKDKNPTSRSSSINTTSYVDTKKDNLILNSKGPLSRTNNKTSKKLKRKFKKDKNLIAGKS